MRTGAGWRARGVVEVAPEATALAAALERRAEPHQGPHHHEPAESAPHDPQLDTRVTRRGARSDARRGSRVT